MLSSTKEFPFDLNPYDSFMRRHLQHYGYFIDRSAKNRLGTSNNCYYESESSDSEDDDTDVSGNSATASQDVASDGRTREEMVRTTQLVYTLQAGRMVLQLREPRQLHGLYAGNWGPQQPARWEERHCRLSGRMFQARGTATANALSVARRQLRKMPAGIQIAIDRIRHISWQPPEMEPFYKPTGQEETPLSISHRGHGRIVYEYEPLLGNYFMHANVNRNLPNRIDEASVELLSDNDNTLIFESRFESGNLAKAVQVGPYEYELWLRTDLYTNKHTQWYYFMISNTRTDVTYRFTIVNHMKPDSLYNNGMRPLMYSEWLAECQSVGWKRTGSDIKYYKNNITYTNGKSEKPYYSLTWTCSLPRNNDTVYFAHCYPYTYSDLQDYINNIMTDPIKSKYCRQRLLCRTLAGNLIYLLTITSPPTSDASDEIKHRKAVVLSARVHPGETNASWMMKGFLDFLLSGSKDAKLLCDNFVFKIVPMLNPDGVIVGNYRCSLTGHDLNRNYKITLKDSFPSIWHTKNMIKRVSTPTKYVIIFGDVACHHIGYGTQSLTVISWRRLLEEREVILYCDLHGHSRRQNVFVYGCENRSDPQRRLREQIFPFMLSRNAPELFSFDYCKFHVQKNKEGTGRVVMWNMGIQNSYTMEATFCGSSLGKKKGYHFSAADLESMGYYFCDTLLDYCDPDGSKIASVLSCLEDRLKTEILHRIRLQSASGVIPVTPDLPQEMADVDLNKHYVCELESSDGGSDSSLSDGPQVQVHFVSKNRKKKKRLKTRKERDLSKAAPGTTKGNKESKHSAPAGFQVRQCHLREPHEHHRHHHQHHHHHHQYQHREQLIEKKILLEPKELKVNHSYTQSILRTATVASAMLQPRKSLCTNSLHRGRHSLRYTDGSIDSDLPAFFQERLEDGNARQSPSERGLIKRQFGSSNNQQTVSESYVQNDNAARDAPDSHINTRSKSMDVLAALSRDQPKFNSAKFVPSDDVVNLGLEDRSQSKIGSPSYVTVMPYLHSRNNQWNILEGITPSVLSATSLTCQQITREEVLGRASVPAMVQMRPYTSDVQPGRVSTKEVSRMVPQTADSQSENSLARDSHSKRHNMGSARHILGDETSRRLQEELSEVSQRHTGQMINHVARTSDHNKMPTAQTEDDWLVEKISAEVVKPLTARQRLRTPSVKASALLRRGRNDAILVAPTQLMRKTESAYTVHVQPLKRPSVVASQGRLSLHQGVGFK